MNPMYFEDFEVGATFSTAARTITESDVMAFAGVSGDFNPLHVDREFCGTLPYGEPIAHGLLVLSVASGLGVQTGIFSGTNLAFLGIEEWRFSASSSSATRSAWSRPSSRRGRRASPVAASSGSGRRSRTSATR